VGVIILPNLTKILPLARSLTRLQSFIKISLPNEIHEAQIEIKFEPSFHFHLER